MAKSLYEALFKEVTIEQTKKELIKFEDKEKFALFRINRLFDSDFSKKTRKSTIRPPSATTPSASALFASPLSTLGLSVPVLAYIPIYPMQP